MSKDKKEGKDEQIADMLLDDFDKFEHFAVHYWKQIVAACILIVVVVAIGAIGYAIYTAADRKANTVIANAKTEAELQQVIKDYPNQKAVWQAYIRLAEMYVGKKDYANAYQQYTTLLKKSVPEEMRREIEVNCGYLLELQGKKKDALAAFAKIGGDSIFPEAMQCEANYSAGRLASELGDKTQAKTYLNICVNRGQKGQYDPAAEFWKRQAGFLLQRLDGKVQPAPTAAPAPAKAAATVKPVAKPAAKTVKK